MASTEVTETAVFFWGSGRAAPRLARPRSNVREAGIHLRGCRQWLTAYGQIEGHIWSAAGATPSPNRTVQAATACRTGRGIVTVVVVPWPSVLSILKVPPC